MAGWSRSVSGREASHILWMPVNFPEIRQTGKDKALLKHGRMSTGREPFRRFPIEPTPEGVNYNMWLGPAPIRPFNKNRFHFTWRWYWEYARRAYDRLGSTPD
jgi:hypothetical protein